VVPELLVVDAAILRKSRLEVFWSRSRLVAGINNMRLSDGCVEASIGFGEGGLVGKERRRRHEFWKQFGGGE